MSVVLSWAGVAVEVSYPAASTRFVNFQPDAQLAFLTLAASSYLYHFCQIGTSVLVSTDLFNCAQDGCSAGLAGLGGFRGRTPRTTALRHTPAERHSRSALGGSGLCANAHRFRQTFYAYKTPGG